MKTVKVTVLIISFRNLHKAAY
jgi:hypothetical protein